jgi:hypothetical protein
LDYSSGGKETNVARISKLMRRYGSDLARVATRSRTRYLRGMYIPSSKPFLQPNPHFNTSTIKVGGSFSTLRSVKEDEYIMDRRDTRNGKAWKLVDWGNRDRGK